MNECVYFYFIKTKTKWNVSNCVEQNGGLPQSLNSLLHHFLPEPWFSCKLQWLKIVSEDDVKPSYTMKVICAQSKSISIINFFEAGSYRVALIGISVGGRWSRSFPKISRDERKLAQTRKLLDIKLNIILNSYESSEGVCIIILDLLWSR